MKKPFYGYILVVYSFLICFLAASFFLHARGVFFPYWMADFQVDRAELSLAVSLTLFTGSLCAPITGYMIDRFPLRNIITVASIWLACGYLMMQFVDSYVWLLLVLIPFAGPLTAASNFALVISAYVGVVIAWLMGMGNALRGKQLPIPFFGQWAV